MSKQEGFASESGHWYDTDGNAAYEVPYADPKKGMRPTTLRDARNLNLYPSVTTIMRIMAAPGLERWKQMNILHSALTLPMTEGESLDDYAKRVIEDAAEQGRKAAQLGTDIHGSLERYYALDDINEEHAAFIAGTDKAITAEFGRQAWCAEKSFAHPLGFGGKVDLHSPEVIIDFKTKEFGPDDVKKLGWDEQAIQLAAYREGLGYPDAKLANVFVSVNNPGLVHIKVWEEKDWFRRFELMLELWKLTKDF